MMMPTLARFSNTSSTQVRRIESHSTDAVVKHTVVNMPMSYLLWKPVNLDLCIDGLVRRVRSARLHRNVH